MALILTIDISDTLQIGTISIKYIKKTGRKIYLAIEADKTININRIKGEKRSKLDKPDRKEGKERTSNHS